MNSYNIARPLMQMVHFIWTYLRVIEDLSIAPGDSKFTLDIVMPTGAMGNMAGAYMAKQLGVPLGTLCAGVNINDVTHKAVSTGIVQRSPNMQTTMSEAINIQLPYNLERLLFYLPIKITIKLKLGIHNWNRLLESCDYVIPMNGTGNCKTNSSLHELPIKSFVRL